MEEMDLNKVIEKVQTEDLSATMLKKIVAFEKKAKSPELAYEIACVTDGETRKQMEDIVLKQKNPLVCAMFATDIYPPVDIEKHKKIIFASKDPEAICYFINRINPTKSELERAQKIIVDLKDPKWAFEFADSVTGANIDLLAKIVIDSKDEKYIKLFRDGMNSWSEVDDATLLRLNKKFNLAHGRQIKAMRKHTPTDELSK